MVLKLFLPYTGFKIYISFNKTVQWEQPYVYELTYLHLAYFLYL